MAAMSPWLLEIVFVIGELVLVGLNPFLVLAAFAPVKSRLTRLDKLARAGE